MTRPSQLERDILNNARERLRMWMRDTAMRCDAVDLDTSSMRLIMLTALTEAILVVGPKSKDRFMAVMSGTHDLLTSKQIYKEESN